MRIDGWDVWLTAPGRVPVSVAFSKARRRGYPENGLACVVETAGVGAGECDGGRTSTFSHMTFAYPNS